MDINEFLEKLSRATGDEAIDLVEKFQSGRIAYVECQCGDKHAWNSDGGKYLLFHCQCRDCGMANAI